MRRSAAVRGGAVLLCLALAGCATFEREVMAPPDPDDPMTQPPSSLMDPCRGLTPAQRAATQGCAGR